MTGVLIRLMACSFGAVLSLLALYHSVRRHVDAFVWLVAASLVALWAGLS